MMLNATGLGLIQDIDVRLTVELGRRTMPLRDVMALEEGSVVELDRLTDEPLDILVNGTRIARGEVVANGNRFAIRVLEMVGGAASPSSQAERRAPPLTVTAPAAEPV